MSASTRAIWLALMIFCGSVVGVGAGVLAWASGDNPFTAVLTGGAAFGGALVLLIAVVHFATSGPKPDQ